MTSLSCVISHDQVRIHHVVTEILEGMKMADWLAMREHIFADYMTKHVREISEHQFFRLNLKFWIASYITTDD